LFRHLDNAKNPVDICASAQDAWNIFTPVLLSGAQPIGPAAQTWSMDLPPARRSVVAHALQDFYAHSNWVEDNIAPGQPERLAAPIFPTCSPAAVPPGLHTGYFSMDFSSDFPLGGCPPGGPPPGFQECHSVLNKDGSSEPAGGVHAPGHRYDLF
jgi:hypothetical protein